MAQSFMILHLRLCFLLSLPLSDELRIWQGSWEIFRLVLLFGLFALTFQTGEMVFKKNKYSWHEDKK